MKIKKILTLITPILSYFALYGVSFAQTGGCSLPANPTFKILVMNLLIGCILVRTAYLIIAAAILVFVYGVFKFVISEGDDKQAGREFMFWGIVGIFIMTSFWGLVAILQNTFRLQ